MEEFVAYYKKCVILVAIREVLMTNRELNDRITKVQELIEEASEFLEGQSEKMIAKLPNFIETSLYENLKKAMQLEEEKNKCIKQLEKILESINHIMSGYCFTKYGFDFENYNTILQFLQKTHYYSKEEQQTYFRSQLLDNANYYNIYMRNGLTLKNLLDGSQKVFQTEEELNDYMDLEGIVCITTHAVNFEEEYKKYYNYLLQHGHEYTADTVEDKLECIVTSLSNVFGGEVFFYGIPFYTDNFRYPENFDNKKYIEYIGKINEMRKNKKFMRAYKLFCNINTIVEELHSASNNYEEFKCNVSHNIDTCSHDILFFQKMYLYDYPQFGLGYCTTIDYYKALDIEAFRNNFGTGAWVWTDGYSFDPECQMVSQNPLRIKYFDWEKLEEKTKIYNEKLLSEIQSAERYQTKQELNEFIQDKCIIVSNENLSYATLLKEYYANFGMNPVEFSQMIQEKYGCEVKIPKKKTVGTKMMVYSNKGCN